MTEKTFVDLAKEAFAKAEYVQGLLIMNTPTDFEERQKAFVKLAEARFAAARAQQALDDAIRTGIPKPLPA